MYIINAYSKIQVGQTYIRYQGKSLSPETAGLQSLWYSPYLYVDEVRGGVESPVEGDLGVGGGVNRALDGQVNQVWIKKK